MEAFRLTRGKLYVILQGKNYHGEQFSELVSSTCENIFHSRSSGIDTTVIIEGGLIKYEPGNFEPFQINHSPRILIVETHVEARIHFLLFIIDSFSGQLRNLLNLYAADVNA